MFATKPRQNKVSLPEQRLSIFAIIFMQRNHHKILAYAEKNLHKPFSIRDISEELGISYHYLQHQFRSISQESLWQMVKRMRLEHAFGYLKHSGFQVSEIGEMVGYSTKHAFSK